MHFYLIVAAGEHEGLAIRVRNDLFMMGTDPSCQLRLAGTGIAPQHCAVVQRLGKVFLRSVAGQEPVLLNGEVMPQGTEWPLAPRDRVLIGHLALLAELHKEQLSRRNMEEWALRCLDEVRKERREDEDYMGLWKRKDSFLNAARSAKAILERLSDTAGDVKGRVRILVEKGVTVVRFNEGSLLDETELMTLETELRQNLQRENVRVLLDFLNVRRCSVKAAEMVDNIARRVHWLGSRVALCRLHREIEPALRTMPVLQGIPIFADKQTALTEKW